MRTMPPFTLSDFLDYTALFIVTHPWLFALTGMALLLFVWLKCVGWLIVHADDRGEMDDTPYGLTDEKAQHVWDSMKQAQLDTVVKIAERRHKNGRAS